MLRVVFSGGPGGGKTTLLEALHARGYPVVPESARKVIRERLALGLPPRPAPADFARAVLFRDVDAYPQRGNLHAGVVFFDRGVVDSLGLMHEAEPMDRADLGRWIALYAYHRVAFLLPPWREIYVTDAERDQTFDEAERVFDQLVQWYRRCGYAIVEVPFADVRQRCDFVLRTLGLPTRAGH